MLTSIVFFVMTILSNASNPACRWKYHPYVHVEIWYNWISTEFDLSNVVIPYEDKHGTQGIYNQISGLLNWTEIRDRTTERMNLMLDPISTSGILNITMELVYQRGRQDKLCSVVSYAANRYAFDIERLLSNRINNSLVNLNVTIDIDKAWRAEFYYAILGPIVGCAVFCCCFLSIQERLSLWRKRRQARVKNMIQTNHDTPKLPSAV